MATMPSPSPKAPDKVYFSTSYTKGDEKRLAAPLYGRYEDRPFQSDNLNLVTMMLLIFANAKRHQPDFENDDIFLELGENQLW